MKPAKWSLEGYDTFEGGSDGFYPLDGKYDDELAAQAAARSRMAELEKTQPSSSSGGQGGIQDQVFIVRPDGSKYRFNG
jgi:hypothetical protein